MGVKASVVVVVGNLNTVIGVTPIRVVVVDVVVVGILTGIET
jgi:hypothetical protein